ncbi:hypothetical protein [Dactylosporangium sp. NPDC000521]|uniref:hypothetical protein n=1 Tax=Dactylosporangium sp. NPDC000521 TaxID=3363975 RepID=UPI003697D2C6
MSGGERRVRTLYDQTPRFAQRRVHPSHAEDAVADAYLVAWRRLDHVSHRPGDART